MSGLASRSWLAVALLAALASPALAVPALPQVAPPVAPAAPDEAPDPDVAEGWALRRVDDVEDRAGVRPSATVHEATQPVLDDTSALHEALMAALADALEVVDGQVVKPVQGTAADLQATVGDVLVPAPEGDGAAPEPQSAPAGPALGPAVTATLLVAGAAAAAGTAFLLWISGSSGTLGAAGTAAGAKIGTSDLRRLLPFASPLFTRFEKDTVLGHPKREALYALIMQSPGVSLQTLCESTGLSRTAVAHHLRLLELQHLIVSKRHGRSRHYFENGGRYGREQKDGYAVLQNGRSKAVADYIRGHPGAIQKELCGALGLQASIAHWHVRRLQEALLVECVRRGRTVCYFPTSGLQQLAAPSVPAAGVA